MNNAFKNLGDFIGGLTTLLMSLIGLAIIAEVAGLQIPDVNVIDSIIAVIGKFEGFVGLVALLVVLAFAKK